MSEAYRNIENEKILIISNNVLSTTNNNGKTILSYFDKLPKKNIRQLYFSEENPSVLGYEYYKLSDRDVLNGKFNSSLRGEIITGKNINTNSRKNIKKVETKHSEFMRLARELIWINSWKSEKLESWLDGFSPTIVFFVGGDCLFAYNIYSFIANKYHVKASLYITDDYIMNRKKDKWIGTIRRKLIRKKVKKVLEFTTNFFTISTLMSKTYEEVLGRKSHVLFNMTDCLKKEVRKEEDEFTILYAGSLYYGRDWVLGKLAETIRKYNEIKNTSIMLEVYTNSIPSNNSLKYIDVPGASRYCGSLDKESLIEKYNKAYVLVFAESFDLSECEKTRYSLSTKISEYLSVGVPILAIGPKNIGSMQYLANYSLCINSMEDLEDGVRKIIEDKVFRKKLSEAASKVYETELNKEKLQNDFWKNICNV